MDPTLQTILLVAPSLASIVMGIFTWSISRNVKREDDDNKKRDATLEEHSKELVQVRADLTAMAHKNELSAHDLRTQVGAISAGVGELKGSLLGLRASFEEGREKQASFYRAELGKLETSMRQELARHIQPDLPARVAALEARGKVRKKS